MFHNLKNQIFNFYIRTKFPTVQVSETAVIDRSAFLAGRIQFGKYVEVLDYARLTGNVRIEDYSYVNFFSELHASAKVSIEVGKFCSLARNVAVVATNDHVLGSLSTYPVLSRVCGVPGPEAGENITIGHDVWIGANSVILPGVHIGDGAAVAAGSVVIAGTFIGPYEIWAGVPAKKVKDRFSPLLQKQIIKLEWWNWGRERIIKNKHLFEGSAPKGVPVF